MGYTWVGVTWFSILFYIWFLYMYEVSVKQSFMCRSLQSRTLLILYLLQFTVDWQKGSGDKHILPICLRNRAYAEYEINHMGCFYIDSHNRHYL